MVHEPWWELHSNMGGHEECILEEVDYCKGNEYIFSMIQGEDEILEDYVKWFQYKLQKSKHKHLTKEILKTLIVKGIKDEFLELLNLIGKGDVF